MAVAGDLAITVERVSHSYATGAQAGRLQTLREVSLEIRRGEMVCLIGPSGCGKSTLLNIIGGLIQPSTGVVKVDGKPIRGPTPNEIAFVFQDNTLFPWSTILENVKVGLEF